MLSRSFWVIASVTIRYNYLFNKGFTICVLILSQTNHTRKLVHSRRRSVVWWLYISSRYIAVSLTHPQVLHFIWSPPRGVVSDFELLDWTVSLLKRRLLWLDFSSYTTWNIWLLRILASFVDISQLPKLLLHGNNHSSFLVPQLSSGLKLLQATHPRKLVDETPIRYFLKRTLNERY